MATNWVIQTNSNVKEFWQVSFSQNNFSKSSGSITIDEAYQILNLDRKKKVTKDDVKKAHAKIQKKIHPDISPETARLSAIVNEAKDIILRDLA